MITFDEALRIMNLHPGYTEAELKKSYRALAMKWHPDMHDGSIESTRMFQKINNANDLLLNYLKHPDKFYEEQAAAERERQAEEDRRAAAEDARKAQERAEEERKKRDAENKIKRLNKIYDALSECYFFDKLNFSREDFISNKNHYLDFYESIFNVAYYVYKHKDEIIADYDNNHLGDNINMRDVVNGETGKRLKSKIYNSILRKSYSNRMRDEFYDLTTSIETVYDLFGDYIDYAYILDELAFDDLKAYVILDDDEREKKKHQAEVKLRKNFLHYTKGFLDDDDYDELKNIHSTKNRDLVLKLNACEKFVKDNITFKKYGAYINPMAPKEVEEIYFAFLRKYYRREDQTPLHFNEFLTSLMLALNGIYDVIHEEAFNVGSDFNKISKSAKIYDEVLELFDLCHNYPYIERCYTILKNNPDKFKNLGLLESLKKLIDRRKLLSFINSYGPSYFFDDIALISDEEFENLLKKSNENKTKFIEMSRLDSKYPSYYDIYIKFKMTGFKTVPFDKAMDLIKSRCEFIETLGLDVRPIEVFDLSDSELKKMAHDKERRDNILFIIEHNPKYQINHSNYEDETAYLFARQEIIDRLQRFDDRRIAGIYKDTCINFLNVFHHDYRQFNVTSEDYDAMPKDVRDTFIKEAERDSYILSLVNKINGYRIINQVPLLSYDDVESFSDLDIFDLESELSNYQKEDAKNKANIPGDNTRK